MYGGRGTDDMYGFQGNDRIFGGPGQDPIDGGPGIDHRRDAFTTSASVGCQVR
jgi:Ca2+-binding RTX toxin-like protein